MSESSKTPEAPQPTFEELLDRYSDIGVLRDRIGFLDITKSLSDGSAIAETIVLNQPSNEGESPEILISAKKHERNGEKEPLTENWRTYISIKRPAGGDLESEVVYPKREDKRLDPNMMFEMATQGLELFDASRQAADGIRARTFDRVFDMMRENDQDLLDMVRRLDQLLPDTVSYDHQASMGAVKMVGMVIKQAASIPITNAHPNIV